MKKVNRNTSSTKSNLEFKYNASGQRVLKIEKPKNSSGVLNQSNWVYTYYVHDAQGNMMSTYTLRYKKVASSQYLETMKVSNYMMYGSNRLGTKEDSLTLSKRKITVNSWNADSSFNSVTVNTVVTLPSLDANHCNRETGYKEYEITNHLGNVQATVTDRKVQVSTTPFTTITSWNPDINTIYDYYPFGAPMPGRNLALAPCSTTVSTVTNTVINETFTGTTGGFSPRNSTLTSTGNILTMTKVGTPATFGSSKTFTQINGVLYTVSFDLGLGSCGGQTITVRVLDPSSGTITTQTYTTAGTKTFTFTATANGTGSIIFSTPGNAGIGCTNFTLDNVSITYDSQNVTTACGSGTDSYMFGFNGQEKDNEAYGEGNAYDFGARDYDPRICRWFSRDPMAAKYPDISPYAFVANSPLLFIDGDGRDIIIVGIENWPDAARDEYMAMMKTALMTTWGQAVYEYYEHSTTDDVYITVVNGVFQAFPAAVAMTTSSADVTTTADDKFSVGNNGPYDNFRDFTVFNNTTVQHPNRRNHLIVISGDKIQNHNEHSNAFSIIHELVAHIFFRGYMARVNFYDSYISQNDPEHYFFGSPYVMDLNSEASDMQRLNDPTRLSPAKSILMELYELKNLGNTSLTKDGMFKVIKNTEDWIDNNNSGNGKNNDNWPKPGPAREKKDPNKNKPRPKFDY